jgi:Predicted membrane protein
MAMITIWKKAIGTA